MTLDTGPQLVWAGGPSEDPLRAAAIRWVICSSLLSQVHMIREGLLGLCQLAPGPTSRLSCLHPPGLPLLLVFRVLRVSVFLCGTRGSRQGCCDRAHGFLFPELKLLWEKREHTTLDTSRSQREKLCHKEPSPRSPSASSRLRKPL